MATLNNAGQGKGNPGIRQDGQKNHKNSNPRSDTRDHQYKEYDQSLTNDENFESGVPINGEPDYEDTQQNVDKNQAPDE